MNRLQQAAETKARKRAERAAAAYSPEPGWTIQPDSPPGTGWVLIPPKKGGPRRYEADPRDLEVKLGQLLGRRPVNV